MKGAIEPFIGNFGAKRNLFYVQANGISLAKPPVFPSQKSESGDLNSKKAESRELSNYMKWRRERDSNPRYAFTAYTRLAGDCTVFRTGSTRHFIGFHCTVMYGFSFFRPLLPTNPVQLYGFPFFAFSV